MAMNRDYEPLIESPREALFEMTHTSGWRYAARRSLELRIAHLMEALALGRRLEMEKMREIQAQIEILRLLLMEPITFLSFGLETGEVAGEDQI